MTFQVVLLQIVDNTTVALSRLLQLWFIKLTAQVIDIIRHYQSQLIKFLGALLSSNDNEKQQFQSNSLDVTVADNQDQWRYQAIVEDQTELICRYLPDTTILYVNDAYCRYFGIDRDELIGKSYTPVIFEADRTEVTRLVNSMNCSNPQVTIENRVIVNEQVRWTQWHNHCFYDEHGQAVECQSVGRDITRLKEIETELRESEGRYRTLIETIPQLVWVAQADGVTRIDYNQRWFDYTGQTPEAVMGKGWLSVMHPDDVESTLNHWPNAVAAGTSYEAEYRLRRADGVYVWHLSKAEPVQNQQGQIVRWYGTCTDISERKRYEAEHQQAEAALQQLNETLELRIAQRTAELITVNETLRQEIQERQQAEALLKSSEERFRRAIVEAPFPIFIHAEEGEILQMSQAILDITGYSSDEIHTIADWTERAYGERQRDILAQINRLYKLNRRINEGEFEVRTKSGKTRTWLFSSAPLGRLNGTRLVISMAADITERKQAKVALANRIKQQAAVAQLSQVALSGLDLTALFDQTTRLVADSLAVEYCKVLELLPNGRSLLLRSGVGWQADLVGQATVSSDRTSQAGYTLLSDNPVIVKDLRVETRFNSPPLLIEHGVISSMSMIIQGQDNRPFGVLGVHSKQHRDFTQDDINFLQAVSNLLATAIQRKQTEQKLYQLNLTLEQRVQDRTQALEAANQELEAFSYSVAHDLRAPLRAIQGFAQVLIEDYDAALDDLGQEYIHRMATSAEHLDILIQDLLTYSRLGRTEVHLQRVSVAAVLEGVLADLQPTLQFKQPKIKIDSNLPVVYAQRSVLKQVLSNLIDNAFKFVALDLEPQIRIWAERQELLGSDSQVNPQRVRIWVEDNGIGIDPKHQERIFKAFERLHGVEAYPGTGIGLAIVKRGIERLGGQVGVESTLNQGSRFWIELALG
ncbi:PAS domain S-box protein [Halotia branconii]|uniref:histidine kinase n=1 Tax=Halotia branconii CENA392 TaxID=1539056 RepID=A0AAJ6NRB7_9CYAN|nr:PAS domain S-box protein [Halotia branconii]WGV25270.1 PAS domain S-box protein [Halotia branconii CENA392]